MHRSKGRYVGILAATVTFGLTAYLLSIGPATGLWARGMLSDEAFDTIYAPVLLLCQASETIQRIVVVYMDLWM